MSETEVDELQQAYQELDYEIVEVHDNLEVPTSTPARFDYQRAPYSTDADKIAGRFEESVLTLIGLHPMNGESWYEFNVTVKVWTPTEEFAQVSLSTAGVTVSKKDHELSFDGFKEIIGAIEWTLRTDLEYTGEANE